MGLFSKKNKEFSGSPTRDGRTSQDSDGNVSPTGTHKPNTLHKRPPIPIDTDPATTTQNSSSAPPSSSLPPYSGGTGYSDFKYNPDQKQPQPLDSGYANGGMGAAGTRRADMQDDPYVTGAATGLSNNNSNVNAANTGSVGRKAGTTTLGSTGTMSNQVYEKKPNPAAATTTTRAGVAGAGAGAGAGILAGRHEQQKFSNDPNLQGYASNTNSQGYASNNNTTSTTTAGGKGVNAPLHESFAMLSIDAARAKLRAAEEKEERALHMVAEARAAAQEARETIDKYAAQVEEEIRLATLKHQDAVGLRQQGQEHLGRV